MMEVEALAGPEEVPGQMPVLKFASRFRVSMSVLEAVSPPSRVFTAFFAGTRAQDMLSKFPLCVLGMLLGESARLPPHVRHRWDTPCHMCRKAFDAASRLLWLVFFA